MKNLFSLLAVPFLLFIVGVACNSNESDKLSADPPSSVSESEPTPSPDIEFVLDLSPEEKLRNTEIILSLPTLATVTKSLKAFGFVIEKYDIAPTARENPIEGELTGLIFGGDGKIGRGDLEYRAMLMGPTKDRVQTIRLQSYGAYSRAAREQLLNWAEALLQETENERIPDDFKTKMVSGDSISGETPASIGNCSLSVLQKQGPDQESDPKRISLDIECGNQPL